MPISAASSTVKRARKRKKVVATEPLPMRDALTLTGSRFWIAQGWRPTSATIHPAWEAM